MLSAIALPVGAALLAASSALPDPDLVIHGCHVASPDRPGLLRDQTVICSHGAIVRIAPDEEVDVEALVAAGARATDARGRYLAPGFYDMHVHLPGVDSSLPAELRATALSMMLDAGITTARVGRGSHELLETRRAVDAGELPGPRLWVPAPPLRRSDFPTLESAEATYAIWRAQGFDAVKFLSAPEGTDYVGHVAAAERAGLPWFGHAPGPDLGLCALTGQASVEHATAITRSAARGAETFERDLRALVGAGVFVCPDLDFYFALSDLTTADALHARRGVDELPAPIVAEWAKSRRLPDPRRRVQGAVVESFRKAVPAMRAAGLKLLVSASDTHYVVPGHGYALEAMHLEAAGYTAAEVFRMATLHGAECLGESDIRGRVAVGCVADLVLLDGDPLESAAALGTVSRVLKAGRWIR